jgi:hypothetical protein
MKKTFFGGECIIKNHNDELLLKKTLKFRQDIMKHWGEENGWRKKNDKEKIDLNQIKEQIIKSEITTYETYGGTSRTEKKNDITVKYHHPVILDLLQQDKKYKLEHNNVIWCLYQKEKKKYEPTQDFSMGLANYDDTIRKIHLYKGIYPKKTISNIINQIPKDFQKKKNSLQPSLLEIFILQYFIDEDNYKKMNELQSPNYSNEERWKSYLELFDNENEDNFLDFDILGSGHEDDLDKRALIIAKRCIDNKAIKSIHTMDGHGRFITRLIKKLIDGNIFKERPDFNILVYDLDFETDLWHKITMPLGTGKEGNILVELNKAIDDKSIDEKIFYINFSGLATNEKQEHNGGVKTQKSIKSKRKTIKKPYKTVNKTINKIYKLTPTIPETDNKTPTILKKPGMISVNQGNEIMRLYERLLKEDKVSHMVVSFANVRDKRYSGDLYQKIEIFNDKLKDYEKKNELFSLTKRNDFLTIGTEERL